MVNTDEKELAKKSEQLWNLVHDAVKDAMRQNQPDPEIAFLGDNTATNRTLRLFKRMADLGYDITIPDFAPKPVETATAFSEGTSLVSKIVMAPVKIPLTILEKIGSGVKAVGSSIAHGLKLVPSEEEESAKA